MRTILNSGGGRVAIGACTLALLLAGCGPDPGPEGVVSVVASTTELADIARHVAGGRAEVAGILVPNSDPHEYEPRPSDAAALAGADLVLSSGGGIDSWLGQLIEASGTDAPVVEMLAHVRTIPSPDGDGADPHWWQNPRNAVRAVREIRDRLLRVDPAGHRTYAANAARYIRELRGLDARIARCMDRIPPARRKLVTSHDALGYYAERYGIEVIGATFPALTTQAQPSTGETQELIETIREAGVRTVFPEAGVGGGLAEAVAEDAGAAVGGELWSDSLGPAGSDGASYAGALASNTEKLAAGFTGEAGFCRIGASG